MSRYVDADKTELEIWDHGVNMGGEYQGVWVRFRDIEEVFKNVPTADVVPVVRCKDCFHSRPDGYGLECTMHYRQTEEEDFCSYGEMR